MTSPEASSIPEWRAIGCTLSVGGGVDDASARCGRPLVGAVLIGTYPVPYDLPDDARPALGVALLCRHHFDVLTAPHPSGKVA